MTRADSGSPSWGTTSFGGLKANAKAYIAVTAPTVNSYKRLVVGAPTSGATWAPAYISYGYNNRSQMLRIPAPGRIEDRTVDGSCNPYLAATAMLTAGMDGVTRGLEAGEPNSANLYTLDAATREAQGVEMLPANLLDATRELEANDALRAGLGTTAEGDYLDYFIEIKRRECRPPTSRSRNGSSIATCSCTEGPRTLRAPPAPRPARSPQIGPKRRAGTAERAPTVSDSTVCGSCASRMPARAMNALAVVSASPSA